MHSAFIFGSSRYGEAPTFSNPGYFYFADGITNGLSQLTISNPNEFELTLTMPKFPNTHFTWESTGTSDGNGGFTLVVAASGTATLSVRYIGAGGSYYSSTSTGTATLPGSYSQSVSLYAEKDTND